MTCAGARRKRRKDRTPGRASISRAWTASYHSLKSSSTSSLVAFDKAMKIPFGMVLLRCGSGREGPAVDAEDLTGDPLGLIGSEEADRGGDVDGSSEPGRRPRWTAAVVGAGGHQAEGHAVGRHPGPEELDGQMTREAHRGGFARAVERDANGEPH